MIKNLKTQQKVSLLSQLNYWLFCAYWRLSKTDEWREKQQVSEHSKKPTGSANWIFCIMNTWWHPKNEMHPEIDKFPLKPDKWHEKVQRSRYARNRQIAPAQNDESWKTAENTKAQANWNFNIMTILLKNSLKIDKNTKKHEKTTKITVSPKQRICTLTNCH